MAVKAPEGTFDLLPDDVRFWDHFRQTAFEIFGRCGYQPIETPLFEQTDLFVRGIGQSTDVVSKEMFTVVSGGNMEKLLAGESLKAKSRLSLRPEGTAGTVRAVVQHDMVPQGGAPAKLMYAGPMFRAERPQKGRLRQFRQVGVECLGADEPTVDAEAIIMLMRFYEAIGIPASETRLLLNSMGCEKCRPAYREMVREHIHQHSEELCEECNHRADLNPLRAFDCKNEHCHEVMEVLPRSPTTCVTTAVLIMRQLRVIWMPRVLRMLRIPVWFAAWTITRARCLRSKLIRAWVARTPSAAVAATTNLLKRLAVAILRAWALHWAMSVAC